MLMSPRCRCRELYRAEPCRTGIGEPGTGRCASAANAIYAATARIALAAVSKPASHFPWRDPHDQTDRQCVSHSVDVESDTPAMVLRDAVGLTVRIRLWSWRLRGLYVLLDGELTRSCVLPSARSPASPSRRSRAWQGQSHPSSARDCRKRAAVRVRQSGVILAAANLLSTHRIHDEQTMGDTISECVLQSIRKAIHGRRGVAKS